jgi:hypothetical protein
MQGLVTIVTMDGSRVNGTFLVRPSRLVSPGFAPRRHKVDGPPHRQRTGANGRYSLGWINHFVAANSAARDGTARASSRAAYWSTVTYECDPR